MIMRYVAKVEPCAESYDGSGSQRRPAPVRSSRFGEGSERAMKDHATEVREASGLVCAAFDEIVSHYGIVVKDFRRVFEIRSHAAELSECGGGLKGLVKTLGQLIRRVPPESYLKKKYTQ